MSNSMKVSDAKARKVKSSNSSAKQDDENYLPVLTSSKSIDVTDSNPPIGSNDPNGSSKVSLIKSGSERSKTIKRSNTMKASDAKARKTKSSNSSANQDDDNYLPVFTSSKSIDVTDSNPPIISNDPNGSSKVSFAKSGSEGSTDKSLKDYDEMAVFDEEDKGNDVSNTMITSGFKTFAESRGIEDNELPLYTFMVFLGLGCSLISCIEKMPYYIAFYIWTAIISMVTIVILLRGLIEFYCGHCKCCARTTSGCWGIGTSIILFFAWAAPLFLYPFFINRMVGSSFGLQWICITSIPMALLFVAWRFKRYQFRRSSEHDKINATGFWRGYWVSLCVLVSSYLIGLGFFVLCNGVFLANAEKVITEQCDFDCLTYTHLLFNGAFFLSTMSIMIVFVTRIKKWRKTIHNADVDANADTNARNISQISAINGIESTDLYIYFIGFALMGYAIVWIHLMPLYQSLLVFVLGSIFVLLARCAKISFDRNRLRELTHLTESEEFESFRRKDAMKYPQDSYSFLAFFNPLTDTNLFCFGLMVFLFQAILLILMIFSVVFPRFRSAGEVDNSETNSNWVGEFMPSNVHPIVRATQIVSIFAYIIIRDANISDVSSAVELLPSIRQSHNDEKSRGLFWSCILRLIQGTLSFLAVFLLVMTSSQVNEIILNFTAVNFISMMDNVAFSEARAGKYGALIESAATKIENEDLPKLISRHRKQKRNVYTIITIFWLLFALLLMIAIFQEVSYEWVTQTLRVQFEDSTPFSSYSGCYEINSDIRLNKRYTYSAYRKNKDGARLGYCNTERRWLFFKGGSRDTNPCQVFGSELEIGHSIKTDSFDIQTIFGENWYSAFNGPLEMYFVEADDVAKTCDSIIVDGKCDADLNNFFYQYDGGDCCAATCSQPDCGRGNLDTGFEVEISSGIGYPDCKNPSMVSISVRLDEVMLNQNYQPAEPDQVENPLFKLDCNGFNVFTIEARESMENGTESAMIEDGSTCYFFIEETYSGSTDDSSVKYSVYHGFNNEHLIGDSQFAIHQGQIGNNMKNESFVVYGSFSRDTMRSNIGRYTDLTSIQMQKYNLNGTIPRDIGYLTKLTALDMDHNQLTGTIPDDIGSLTKLTQLDLSVNKIYGTIPSEIWLMTELTELDLSLNNFEEGTLPTEIGLLTKLKELGLESTSLYGSLPSEVWSLTGLQKIHIGHNKFDSGTIPSEIGLLTELKHLSLPATAFYVPVGNKLYGTIPSEIWSLTKLTHLDLADNTFVGGIPSDIQLLTDLEFITLSGNLELGGTIPTEVGLLTNLKFFNMSVTGLRGTIPSEIANASSLEFLSIWGNLGMFGTVPSEFSLLPNLKVDTSISFVF